MQEVGEVPSRWDGPSCEVEPNLCCCCCCSFHLSGCSQGKTIGHRCDNPRCLDKSLRRTRHASSVNVLLCRSSCGPTGRSSSGKSSARQRAGYALFLGGVGHLLLEPLLRKVQSFKTLRLDDDLGVLILESCTSVGVYRRTLVVAVLHPGHK